MNWYYAEGQQQRGPIPEKELDDLSRQGKITPRTLVWRPGMASWQSYHDARGGEMAQPPVEGTQVCPQCGKSFSPVQAGPSAGEALCPTCHPEVKQAEQAQGASPEPVVEEATPEQILTANYEVDIAGCLSEAWVVFTKNSNVLVAGIFGVFATVLLLSMVTNLLKVPDVVAMLLLPVITGPLLSGVWMLAIKSVRDDGPTMADAFGGFGPRFKDLAMTAFTTSFFSNLCLLPAAVFYGVIIGWQNLDKPVKYETFSALPPSSLVTGLALMLAGILAATYLSLNWLYAMPLVADKGLGFRSALWLSWQIVSKQWWMTLLLTLVVGAVSCAGILACGVGLLVTIPLGYLMFAVHYMRIFRKLKVPPGI